MSSGTESLLTLTLTRDNVSNCDLVDDNGKVYYQVITEHTDKSTTTTIRNASNEIIASLEWRDTLADKVTYGQGKPMSLWDWMKKSYIPFNDTISFTDESKRSYKWKGNTSGRSLELYTSKPNSPSPIAKFLPAKRGFNPEGKDLPHVWSKPQFVIDARGQEIQDLIVASFLFLEKNRRTNEATTNNLADIEAAPALNVIGPNYNAHNGGV